VERPGASCPRNGVLVRKLVDGVLPATSHVSGISALLVGGWVDWRSGWSWKKAWGYGEGGITVGGKRTDAISARDLEVLEFVARFGVVPRRAVGLWAGTGEAVTWRWKRRLRKVGSQEDVGRLPISPTCQYLRKGPEMLVDGYVRVSQVSGRSGARFISPVVQREQIEGWAKLHGAVIGEVYEELDESGARADRPLLMQAIERVEAHESDGIVVAKLDRFGRSLVDSLAGIERIRKAGGTFVSVQDGLDLSTDTGKLVLRIMFSMAEWELDRIRAMWDTAKARAITRGVHVGKMPPFGYRRDGHGRLEVHPQKGPAVAELFRRRAQGEALSTLCRWLEDRGFTTGNGNTGWTNTTLRGIVANRTYLGELHSGSHVALGTHQPLTDEATWQTAQTPRELPAKRRGKQPTLLGGLLRCAGCRVALHSGVAERSGGRLCATYVCHGRSAGGACPSRAYISGSLIEPHIEEAFFSALRHQGRRGAAATKKLERLELQVTKAKDELAAYRDAPMILTTLGTSAYLAGLQNRQREVALALNAVAQERRRVDAVSLPQAEEMETRWPQMTINERRSAIAEMIDAVFIERGRGRVKERAHIYYRGQCPLDLPRPGTRTSDVRSFNPSELPAPRRIREAPAWSIARIGAELKKFLVGRTVWPFPEEFHRAGYGPLYRQLLRSGGPARWADRMGVAPLKGSQALRAWDDEAIRATLTRFLRGKAYWPTPREFKQAGFGAVYRSLQGRGEIDRWVGVFGLPRRSDSWDRSRSA
jgi:DNA invertase Pin-like site-specific DNA recombinase